MLSENDRPSIFCFTVPRKLQKVHGRFVYELFWRQHPVVSLTCWVSSQAAFAGSVVERTKYIHAYRTFLYHD